MSLLIERDRSCLLVIDLQDCFLDNLPANARAPLVERIAWLVRVAGVLEIPVIAMAEDIARQRTLVSEVSSLLPSSGIVHDKMVFGLAGQPDIVTAIERTGRRDMIITGLETDTCVAQSALGLIDAGYRVAVIEDAVASPSPGHERGLDRVARAGAIVTSVKGLYYEWVRDVQTDDRVKAVVRSAVPSGLVL